MALSRDYVLACISVGLWLGASALVFSDEPVYSQSRLDIAITGILITVLFIGVLVTSFRYGSHFARWMNELDRATSGFIVSCGIAVGKTEYWKNLNVGVQSWSWFLVLVIFGFVLFAALRPRPIPVSTIAPPPPPPPPQPLLQSAAPASPSLQSSVLPTSDIEMTAISISNINPSPNEVGDGDDSTEEEEEEEHLSEDRMRLMY